MARKAGDSTRRGPAGAAVRNDPPRSTITAQIIDASKTNDQQEPQNAALFGQLLQEFLTDPSVEEPNVMLNLQLLSVVVEAGFNALLKENLFGQDALLPQARDSLSVIRITVERNPRLLFYQNTEEAEGDSKPPLVAWLLPKLFSLLARPLLHPIYTDITELFAVFIRLLSTGRRTWQNANALIEIYQACIDSILTDLDYLTKNPFQSASALKSLLLPPLSSIRQLLPDSQQLVVLPDNCQAEITKPDQSTEIALALLGAICSQHAVVGTTCMASVMQISMSDWAADRYSRLLQYALRLMLFSTSSRSQCQDLSLPFLYVLKHLVEIAIDTESQSFTTRALSLTVDSIVTLLDLFCRVLPSFPAQHELSNVLLRVSWLNRQAATGDHASANCMPLFNRLYEDELIPALQSIALDKTQLELFGKDLQLAILVCAEDKTGCDEATDFQVTTPVQSAKVGQSFKDTQLAEGFSELLIDGPENEFPDNERPRKRQRIDQSMGPSLTGPYYNRLAAKAPGYFRNNVLPEKEEIQREVANNFANLSHEAKSDAMRNFARLPCAAVGTLTASVLSNGELSAMCCSICDGEPDEHRNSSYWDEERFGETWKAAVETISKMVEVLEEQRSKECRVLAAMAIRNLVCHLRDSDTLDLENKQSPLAMWCLKSLRSSFRELRIAAGYALPMFLRKDVPTTGKNRSYVLGYLKILSRERELSRQETLILAFGQIARTCVDEELNMVLLELVEYLGHPEPMICGVAFNELCSLTKILKCTPRDLFKPFWRSIGIRVLEELFTRPQKTQQLADFLGLSVSQFLSWTQVETVPYLVLMKKKDVLKKIALARGPNCSVETLCMDPNNLAATLAMLLLKLPDADIAMVYLVAAAPEFEAHEFQSLVRTVPATTAAEILRAAAEAEPGPKKQKIHQDFQTLTVLVERKPGQSRSTTKDNKMMGQFFDNHILGVMAVFSGIIDNTKETQPMSERRISLGAIQELIELAKEHVSFGLPQIRACLQSAFDVPQLRNKAFSVWSSLLSAVTEEDIEPLIDQTFSVIAQNWDSFDPDVQTGAHDLIDGLVKKHNAVLRNRINMLPSLASIPMMNKIDSQIKRFKQTSPVGQYAAFSQRCANENAPVVTQALKDLIIYLEENQSFVHESVASQHPSPLIAELCRSVMDASARFTETHPEINILSAKALGLIGCLDPSRAEAVRPKRDVLMLSNMDKLPEVLDFTVFILETVLVKVFQSASNAHKQNFLACAIQDLLKCSGFRQDAHLLNPRSSQTTTLYERWAEIPESVRSTLTPLLTSKYKWRVNDGYFASDQKYPIFSPEKSHGHWLRTFVCDLLLRGKGENVQLVFPVIARVVKGNDLAISVAMLPFAVVNIILAGTEKEVKEVSRELLGVLECQIHGIGPEVDNVKRCSENVFQVLDYMSRWLQGKRRELTDIRTQAAQQGREPPEKDVLVCVSQISSVESVLHSIPAEIISKRAVECGSYARALFHWEQYIRQRKETVQIPKNDPDRESLYQHLQYIYTQIDEPDSIEGISAHLQILDPKQQVLEHRKAGRWNAAQSWYELSLADKPDDVEVQYELVNCLRESGQYDSLLARVESFCKTPGPSVPKILSLASEASWMTGKWQTLQRLLTGVPEDLQDFNIGLGKAFLKLHDDDMESFSRIISGMREGIARGLSTSTTASLQACHDHMLKLHILYELEVITGTNDAAQTNREGVLQTLSRRLDVLGAYTADKQYLLGLRRAAMQLSQKSFTGLDLASAWLTSARLARKSNKTSTAFDAVLHATRLGEDEAKIEHSRLLWKSGHHRKAIQNLDGAINMNLFRSHDTPAASEMESMNINEEQQRLHNKLTARACLLKAKWLDEAGQTSSNEIIYQYQDAIKKFPRQEKGHYLLGKHYNKNLEYEKSTPREKWSTAACAGETAKLVIECYLRAAHFGTRHIYETIPKLLTLWLDLGIDATENPPPKVSEREEQRLLAQGHILFLKQRVLKTTNFQMQKYAVERIPTYILYTALPQMLTRICHPNSVVYEILKAIIVRVAAAYPQQSLWSLLAVVKAKAVERQTKGLEVLKMLKDYGKKNKIESSYNLNTLINQGQRISEALLNACDLPVETRVSRVSLGNDLRFSHKLAPCPLVVPVETTLHASMPTLQDPGTLKNHKAFSGNIITINSFSDVVLVLSSLQRPRKLTVRGSDGRNYGLLCKPKDDLRKDQRLMEFNSMINRSLLRDVESSKRRLNIKTYAVTPLNEECGAIEWVEGLKPMRDIILKLYREKDVKIDYHQTRNLLNEACSDAPGSVNIFTDKILKHFRPVLYEWFIETFPEPEAWFTARLKYTRSCAVMSIVGHVLGLGDRHGENVLLVEDDGGVFHVDFNCLFDKGLTFEKPELVPFRLTHNMVDAMGPQGTEGAFRTAAELTLSQLRQNIDTLMTILETFLYDPTADFIGKKKRRGVPSTPEEVLDSVRKKVGGLLEKEVLPLSVEGYVDFLVSQATDPRRLAQMYIGWCAFF
ncbi:uncharacterized protein K452DRAFT_322886 [Aplosporella prunicola CBS 121167]|uniref:Serine/threonine-protein kinase MEC1 n=1 Tax=Aplosporella prunicola CBS 121167 TaxID=1176127 RepID=A0A6A6AY69_9PEZI|nr:uncharacterized protein K452DRAFT_322886 [Aplosporella prunicola CBS 121167]KAF2135717.1 hypothetical protein K452DRAFT_322886 [Aplosporella prunicola CBS 121167]